MSLRDASIKQILNDRLVPVVRVHNEAVADKVVETDQAGVVMPVLETKGFREAVE